MMMMMMMIIIIIRVNFAHFTRLDCVCFLLLTWM